MIEIWFFRYGPFFMGWRGMFLAPWSLDFNLEAEITIAQVWVGFPYLHLHLWGKNSLMGIDNKLGHFLDNVNKKGVKFSCSHIFVEINLEKGILEALKLNVEG